MNEKLDANISSLLQLLTLISIEQQAISDEPESAASDEEEPSCLEKDNEEKDALIKKLRNKIQALKNDNETLQKKVQKGNKALKDDNKLHEENAKLHTNNCTLKKKLEKLTKRLKRADGRLDALCEINKNANAIQDQLEVIEDDVGDAKSKMEQFEAEGLEAQITDLDDKLENQKLADTERHNELDYRVAQSETNIANINEDMREMVDETVEAQCEDRIPREVDEAVGEAVAQGIASVQQEYGRVGDTVEAQGNMIEDNEQNIASNTNRIQVLENEREQGQQEIARLNARLEQYEHVIRMLLQQRRNRRSIG